MNTNIRWLIRRDLDEVMDIERASFPDPWTRDELVSVQRHSDVIGVVVERTSYERGTYEVLGVMLYQLRDRETHIIKIAVRPDVRGQGIGTQMVDMLKGKLSQVKRRKLTATIRESNLDGQLFFQAMGLRCEQIHRGHFAGYGEDGYEFEYRLAERVQPSIREGA